MEYAASTQQKIDLPQNRNQLEQEVYKSRGNSADVTRLTR